MTATLDRDIDNPFTGAPCTQDPESWFIEGATREAQLARAEAIRLCHQCPALLACRALADRLKASGTPLYGVWAGCNYTTKNPRMDRIVDDLLACGTEAGQKRHWRRGEKPCRPCVAAAYRAKLEREAVRS